MKFATYFIIEYLAWHLYSLLNVLNMFLDIILAWKIQKEVNNLKFLSHLENVSRTGQILSFRSVQNPTNIFAKTVNSN